MTDLMDTTALASTIGVMAQRAVAQMQLAGRVENLVEQPALEQAKTLRDLADFMQDEMNAAIFSGMEAEAQYMEALATSFPDSAPDVQSRIAEVMSHFANARGAMDFDFTRDAMHYYKTAVSHQETDEKLRRDKDIALQITVLMQEQVLRAEALALLQHEAHEVLKFNEYAQEAVAYRDANPEKVAEAEALILDTHNKVAEMLGADSHLTEKQKAALQAYVDKYGGENFYASPKLLQEIDTLSKGGEAFEATLQEVDAESQAYFDPLMDSVFKSLDEKYADDPKLLEGFRKLPVKDENGHYDMSAISEKYRENEPKVLREINKRNKGAEYDAELVALGISYQSVQVANAVSNPYQIAKIQELGRNKEVLAELDKLESVDEKITYLQDKGLMGTNETEVALTKRLLELNTTQELEALGNMSTKEIQSTLGKSIREHSDAVLGAVFAEASDLSRQTNDAIERAQRRYSDPKHPLHAELNSWVQDLKNSQDKGKLALFERFASGEFSDTEVSAGEMISAARAARAEELSVLDTQATTIRIAASKELANLYPGDPNNPESLNGHQEYYAAFKAQAREMMEYPDYTPPVKGETPDQTRTRMDGNVAHAVKALIDIGATRNEAGLYSFDTTKVFLTKEVRTELVESGMIDLRTAEALQQNGKIVYGSMVENYLMPKGDNLKPELLVRADANITNSKPIAEWDADVRMAFMLRQMHTQSEGQVLTSQLAAMLRDSNLHANDLQAVISAAVSKPSAKEALDYLTENTALNADTPEMQIYLSIGLAGMKALGDDAGKALYNVAHAMEENPEKAQTMIAELAASFLPEGVSVGDIQSSPYMQVKLSELFSDALYTGKSLPSSEAIAHAIAQAQEMDTAFAELQKERVELTEQLVKQGVSEDDAKAVSETFVKIGGPAHHEKVLSQRSFGTQIVITDDGQAVAIPGTVDGKSRRQEAMEEMGMTADEAQVAANAISGGEDVAVVTEKTLSPEATEYMRELAARAASGPAFG